MENAFVVRVDRRAVIKGSARFTACFASLLVAGCNVQGRRPEPGPPTTPPVAQHAPLQQQALVSPQPIPQGDTATPVFPAPDRHQGATLSYRIIDAPDATFGYDILSDGRLFVQQTSLPGIPGNAGCKTQADAEKLAAYVIAKIKKGEMPPSVTPEELKALNIH